MGISCSQGVALLASVAEEKGRGASTLNVQKCLALLSEHSMKNSVGMYVILHPLDNELINYQVLCVVKESVSSLLSSAGKSVWRFYHMEFFRTPLSC